MAEADEPPKPLIGSESPEKSFRYRRLMHPSFWEKWDSLPKTVRRILTGVFGVIVLLFLVVFVHVLANSYRAVNKRFPQLPSFGLTSNPQGANPPNDSGGSSSTGSSKSSGSGASRGSSTSSGAASLPPASSPPSGYAIVFDSNRTGHFEIYRQNPGGAAQQLTNNAAYDSWWGVASPNGSQILFYRTPAGVHDRDYGQTSLWMMNSDGSNQRQLIATGANGWTIQGHAEWSPNGQQLVMFGGANIWLTDTNGNLQHTITVGLDPSFTPDGQHIVFIRCAILNGCAQSNYRVFRTDLNGGGLTQLEDLPYRANDPYASPNGSYISWETNISGLVWAIGIANSDGSNAHILLNDGNINTNPTWSPRSVIFFFKTKPGQYPGYGLWVMNADASGLQWISQGQPGSNEYVSVIP